MITLLFALFLLGSGLWKIVVPVWCGNPRHADHVNEGVVLVALASILIK